jgi:pimeloyl-ACP methyl ester carboxylesterase
MGLSSRKDKYFDNSQDYINFFKESLEQWREKLELKEIHLLGHSLGGYIACHYTNTHPERIQ